MGSCTSRPTNEEEQQHERDSSDINNKYFFPKLKDIPSPNLAAIEAKIEEALKISDTIKKNEVAKQFLNEKLLLEQKQKQIIEQNAITVEKIKEIESLNAQQKTERIRPKVLVEIMKAKNVQNTAGCGDISQPFVKIELQPLNRSQQTNTSVA